MAKIALFYSIILLLFAILSCKTLDPLAQDALQYQQALNSQFSSPETSILEPQDLDSFEGLEFFPYHPGFNVIAQMELTPDAAPFQMITSTDRRPLYRSYGILIFDIDGHRDTLHAYEDIQMNSRSGPEIRLFVPFTDETSGAESYGGGRYIDFIYFGDESVRLDFNQCYNPLCAYNEKYSCPVPPAENHVNTRILAGVKAPAGH